MDGQRHALTKCSRTGIHAARPVGTHGDGGVLIAPVMDMIGEQVGADTKLAHAPELAGIGHLAMLQRVAVVRPVMCFLRRFNGIEHELRGFIAIGMNMQMHAGLMIAQDQLG